MKQPSKQASTLVTQRMRLYTAVRTFFYERKFLEVETPLLVRYPDPEPTFDLFSTSVRVNEETKPGYLTTSPEFFMKRLIAEGIERQFQITKAFRNGELGSSTHNPEFSILEWYRAHADYTIIMDDCEALLRYIAQYFNAWKTVNHEPTAEQIATASAEVAFKGTVYDLSKPWERVSVAHLFEKHVGIPENVLLNSETFIETVAQKGYSVDNASFQELFDQVFLNEIEPFLGVKQPTIVYDYFASQAALARLKPADTRFAERFEFYIAGLELGNAFSELTDAKQQRARFTDQNKERLKLDKADVGIDETFLAAVERMPATAGIAVGLDRLLMIFMDTTDIHSVLLFPADDMFS